MTSSDRGRAGAAGSGSLSIVVPVWNGGAILAASLPRSAAEARSLPAGGEVVVVDDGSEPADARLAEVVARAGGPVRLLRLDAHRGFAAACNAGAAAAAGELLLFLNNDMEVEEGCCGRLLAALASRRDVFAVTPVIHNLAGGFPESTTRIRFHRGVFDLLFPGRDGLAPPGPDELRPLAFACGGALMCRRSDFHRLGGFSTAYAPFYWEDADLGWRALRAGLAVVEVGGALVEHAHARTIAASFSASRIRAVYERNRLLFTWTHLMGGTGWTRHLGWLAPRWLAAAARRDGAARGMLAAFGGAAAVARERRRLADSRGRARGLLAAVVAAGPAGWPAPAAAAPGGERAHAPGPSAVVR